MSQPHGDPLKKDSIYLVLILVFIAGSLFMIFTYVATMMVSEALGVGLFLVVVGLLIGGYMTGLIVLAFVAIAVLTRHSGVAGEQQPTKHSA